VSGPNYQSQSGGGCYEWHLVIREDFGNGYCSFNTIEYHYERVPDDVCPEPLVLNEETRICEEICDEEDVPFPENDPNAIYSDSFSDDSVCSIVDKYIVEKEQAKINCEVVFRCKARPDNDNDGIDDYDDTDDDNDKYSDEKEEIDGTDPLDPSSNSGDGGDGGGTNGGGDTGGGDGGGGDTGGGDTGGGDTGGGGDNDDPSGGGGDDNCDATCGAANNSSCSDTLDFDGTPLALVTYQDCELCINVTREYSMTCAEYYGVNDGNTTDPNIDNCSHDSSRHGRPFQGILPKRSDCEIAIQNYAKDGIGYWQSLPNCSQGSVACFYEKKSDNFDNNNSIPDSNSSDSFDDSGIINKLDEIKKINSVLNSSVSSVEDSINTQTNTLSQKLDNLKDSNRNSALDVKDAVNNQNKSLGSKLDALKTAINNKPVGTDMTTTNSKLDGIKDSIDGLDEELEDILNPDLDVDTSEVDGAFDLAKNTFNNALVSFDSSANDIKSLFTSARSPTVTASGTCVLSRSLSFGSTNFDFNALAELRLPLQIVFNIMLIIFSIKLYTRIARDLVSYMLGGGV